jgi:AraC family transcriptional regulator of adaptative response/methylated-DNA-[protein]-cysteine methyltransferase
MGQDHRLVTAQFETPLGTMQAAATVDGLCLVEFADTQRAEDQLRRVASRLNSLPAAGASPFFDDLQSQLDEYFAGRRRQFELPLVLGGTPFQILAWAALQTIPYGQTRSYRAQAELLGRPAALRALGKANGDNPIAIIVPCHRMVGSDGSLTGYGGGLWRKEWLLELEKDHCG